MHYKKYTCVIYDTPRGQRRVFYKDSARIPKSLVPPKVYNELKCYIISNKGTQGIRHASVLRPASRRQRHVDIPLAPEPVVADSHKPKPVYLQSPKGDEGQGLTPSELVYFSKLRDQKNAEFLPLTRTGSCHISKAEFARFLQFISGDDNDDDDGSGSHSGSHSGSSSGSTPVPVPVPLKFENACQEIMQMMPQTCFHDKWEVVGILGRGAYGIVFLLNEVDGTKVALRKDRQGQDGRQDQQDPQGRQASLKIQVTDENSVLTPENEINMQRVFAAENLAPLVLCVDTVVVHGQKLTLILMEKIDFTLGDLLSRHKIPKVYVNMVTRGVVALLERMRELQFTHGDFHDENIGFRVVSTPSGPQVQVLLLDFGMSTARKNYAELDAEQLYRSLLLSKYNPVVVEFFNTYLQQFLTDVAHSTYTLTGNTRRWIRLHDLYIAKEFKT